MSKSVASAVSPVFCLLPASVFDTREGNGPCIDSRRVMRPSQLPLLVGLVLLFARAVPGGSVDSEHFQHAGHLHQHVLQLELEAAADEQHSELRQAAQTALAAADASTLAEAAKAKTALRRNLLRLDSAIGILDQEKPAPKKAAQNSTAAKKADRQKNNAAEPSAATTTASPSSDAKQEEAVEAAKEKDAAIEAKLKKERRQKRIQSQYRKCKSGCEELESQVRFEEVLFVDVVGGVGGSSTGACT